MKPNKSVPTIIVVGFLGTGKTTLINNFLRQANGIRITVFVNDFGAINIDHDLIEAVEKDRIALSNGCICCTLNEDLVRVIVEYCQTEPPDLFVIEASGVANPKSLISTMQVLQRAGQSHLQSQIYIVDAAHFGSLGYEDVEELIDHAATSDLILINKCDLACQDRIDKIEKTLARSAPRALRKTTTKARLSLTEILNLKKESELIQEFSHSKHNVNKQFCTVAFEHIPPLSQRRFDELIKLLQDTCLRAKGFLTIDGYPQSQICIQQVSRQVETTIIMPNDTKSSRLVTIGWHKKMVPEHLSELLGVKPIDSL